MISNKETIIVLSLLLAGAVLSGTAQASDPNVGRNLAATCALCHGTDGKSTGTFPALAGQDKTAIAAKMKEFKAGKHSPTIMHQISKGFTDEQIDLMAGYFSAQK